jgi:hypothetical protein
MNVEARDPARDPARAAARLRLLPQVEPPRALLSRILAALPDRPHPGDVWPAEVVQRPVQRWVQWGAAAAAVMLLSLGLLGTARAASRAADEGGPRRVAANRPAAVVDDPGLVSYSTAEPFDPFQPLGRGEPNGGP